MDKVTIHISANEQLLTSAECPLKVASNTVSYIEAVFELGENWTGYDSVRAVWSTYMDTIATVLDSEGKCVVPHEVMTRTQKVFVNLVGSVVEDDELTDRLTTYPILAVVVNADALVEGTETAPITPSQFEQFVNEVSEEVSKIKDIVSTTLNDDYTLTFVFSDGTETTVGPIRGEQGEQGIQGIQGPPGPPGEVTLATLESLMPTDTANGSIASFPDGQSVFPLKSLVADINPIQDLHGYDSPWVGDAGANKWDEEWELGTYSLTDGSPVASMYSIRGKNRISVNPSTAYYCNNNYLRVLFYDANDSFISYVTGSGVKTTPSNCAYIRMYLGDAYGTTYKNDIAINYPSTVTTYSPYSNICPISGWNSVGVTVGGTNYADLAVNGFINNTDGTDTSDNGKRTPYFEVSVGDKIYCTWKNNGGGWRYSILAYYDSNKNFVSNGYYAVTASGANGTTTQTVPSGVAYARFASRDGAINDCMVITTHTTTLPSTVYGGTLDVVSGVLTIDRYYGVGIDWSQYNTSNGYIAYRVQNLPVSSAEHYSTPTTAQPISNMVAEFGTFSSSAMNKNIIQITAQDQTQWTYMALKADANPSNVQLCYKLATPTTIQLTASQINTLKGMNNIFSTSGDVSVEYVADIQGYIDKQ